MNAFFKQYKSIAVALGAQILAQGTTVLIQISSIPIYLHIWDISVFGVWLILLAIPSALMFIEGGIYQTTALRLANALSKKQFTLVTDTIALTIKITGGILIVGIAVILLIPNFYEIPKVQHQNTTGAFYLLGLMSLLSILQCLADAIIRAFKGVSTATTISNISRLLEWIGLICGAMLTEQFVYAAMGGLLLRFATLATTSRVAELLIREHLPSLHEVLRAKLLANGNFILSSMQNFSYLISGTILHNGLSVAIERTHGTAIVAIFITHRTVSRIAYQVGTLGAAASQLHFARSRDITNLSDQLRNLRYLCYATFAATTAFSGIVYFIADDIFSYWTNQKISFDAHLGIILLLVALANALWLPIKIFLQSYEAQLPVAITQTVGSILVLLFAINLKDVATISQVALAWLTLETITLLIAVLATRKISYL